MKRARRVCWPLVVLVAGCVNTVRWVREDVHPVAVQGDRHLDRARMWSGDRVLDWRAVLITRDSVSGVPAALFTHCDSCRITVPSAAIDSLKVGYTPTNTTNPNAAKETSWWPALLVLCAIFCPYP